MPDPGEALSGVVQLLCTGLAPRIESAGGGQGVRAALATSQTTAPTALTEDNRNCRLFIFKDPRIHLTSELSLEGSVCRPSGAVRIPCK
jgi:hypothetical protein